MIVAGGGPGLVLPADKAKIFLANLEEREEPLVSWQKYTLRRGDRLDHIAAQHGISLARLKADEQHRPAHQGRIAATSCCCRSKARRSSPCPRTYRPPAAAEPSVRVRKISYTVRRGDTLLGIAAPLQGQHGRPAQVEPDRAPRRRPAPGDRGAPDGTAEASEVRQQKALYPGEAVAAGAKPRGIADSRRRV